MKVNFKGQSISVKNESKEKQHFVAHWCGYAIDVERAYGEWDYCVKDFDQQFLICDCTDVHHTMTELVQKCFDAIEKDIEDLKQYTSNSLKTLKELRKYQQEITCPICGSKKVFKFRLDSDWGSGSGDYSTVNGNEHYTEEELEYDGFDRPDIVVYHCGDCDHLFD